MQLKGEASIDPRKRFHMINKLRKADHYTQELSNLCDQVNVDPRTKLEVQVVILTVLEPPVWAHTHTD